MESRYITLYGEGACVTLSLYYLPKSMKGHAHTKGAKLQVSHLNYVMIRLVNCLNGPACSKVVFASDSED